MVFVFTFIVVMLIILGMSVGALAGRGAIKGTCGGLAAMTDGDCEICGGDPHKCDAQQDEDGKETSGKGAGFYNAGE